MRNKEILKYKQNSLNHLLHDPIKGSSQAEGTYIHISTIYESMDEFSIEFGSFILGEIWHKRLIKTHACWRYNDEPIAINQLQNLFNNRK